MKKRKPLGLGIDNFKKIINENYYYFDKTEMIEELLINGSEVTLFTRPRRFGKTLNMSMLKYFFDVRKREENKALFNDLYISKSEWMVKQGQHPVILVSFKDIKKSTWESSYEKIRRIISSLFKENIHIMSKLSPEEQREFDSYLKKDEKCSMDEALYVLSEYLTRYYGKKVILLIDEYDTPLIYAYENGYYDEAINFFRTLYGTALKGNKYLEKAVLTGILRVVKEGIFSDLNNLVVYTVLDRKYSNHFGLTEEEVITGLRDYELYDTLEDVRKWYNGYRFGEADVYNPWSIINYLNRKELGAYWVNTSNDNTINRLIGNANSSMFEDLKEIFEGKKIDKTVNVFSDMSRMSSPKEIWHLMLFSGYLTTSGREDMNVYNLKIPNYEVRTFFKDSFVEYNFDDNNNFRAMINALITKNMKEYEHYLKQIMLLYLSYYDGSRIDEKPYHNLILGSILYLEDRYMIDSNIEKGFGRTDLTLTPKDRSKSGYVFEFKVVESKEKIESGLDEALAQMKAKRYDVRMKNEGIPEVIGIGMVFYGKQVKIRWEIL